MVERAPGDTTSGNVELNKSIAITGGAGNDTITGSHLGDNLDGGGGNNVFVGGGVRIANSRAGARATAQGARP